MIMRLTPFALSGLLGGSFTLVFGLLVLFKSANRKLGVVWCLFSLAAATWGFGAFWIGICDSADTALLAWRIAYVGVVFIPSVFFHFVCTFCELKRPRLIWAHYFYSLFYLLLLPTDYFFYAPRLMFGSLYFPLYRWSYVIFVAWWIGFVIYSHAQLWRAYRKANAIKREQIKYFFLGTAIGYCGGSQVYLANFGINVYPWGNFTVFLYPLVMSYAIIRFNLMDIRVLVRRTALIVLVYLALLLVSVPVLGLIHAANAASPSTFSSLFEALSAGLILSTGPFFYAYVVRRNSYFQDYTLAGLTHELKSPLAVIDSALEFLNANPDLKSVDTRQLTAYLSMIQRNSSRLQYFVNDLLHAFQYTRNNSALEAKRVDLRHTIQSVIDRSHNQLQMKFLTSDVRLPADPVFVNGDALKLEQAFSNVLSNAIKFSSAGTITVGLDATTNAATISVADNGSGIPTDELPYIFDRFYQGTTGRKNKGTGIGLTIAKLWIEAHGGKIWAESEGEGKGTTVTFTVPV